MLGPTDHGVGSPAMYLNEFAQGLTDMLVIEEKAPVV